MHSRCCWPPDRAPPGESSRSRTSFHRPARSRAHSTSASGSAGRDAGQLEPGEHVVADGHGRERVRLLEHHADAHAHLLGAHAPAVDVVAVEQDLAVERGAGDQLVHAVEHPQEGRLAAAGRADERGDLAARASPGRRPRAPGGRRTRRRRRAPRGWRGPAAGRRPARGRRSAAPTDVVAAVSAWSSTVAVMRAPGDALRRRRWCCVDRSRPTNRATANRREHDQHQHQGAGERPVDGGRARACGCCGRRRAGRLSWGPSNGLAFMQVGAEGGEQQRGGLADGAGDAEHDRGGDPGAGGGQHDRPHHRGPGEAPRARPASRRPSGTSRSTTSTVRVIGRQHDDGQRQAGHEAVVAEDAVRAGRGAG